MSNANRHPLVVFSGGMDSSYMLYEALLQGNVHTCYIKGTQSSLKIPVELEARKKIAKILQEKTGNLILTDTVVDLAGSKPIYTDKVNYNGGTIHTYGNDAPDITWGQAYIWLFGLMFVTDGRIHSEVQIGNVMDDDINMHLDNMKLAWETTQKFSKRNPIPLVFPLSCQRKFNILSEMPKQALAYIWVCDRPKQDENDLTIPCEYCASCVDHKKTIWEYEYRNREAFNIHPKAQQQPAKGQQDLFYNLY